MDFEREYAFLNSAQKKAVDLIEGPEIVIAGPGTGKTQLLSMRTANILKLTDALPENILCLTFTEAASENMRQRLIKLVGKAANKVGIFTFHGFGAYIIQNYPEFFYDAPLVGQLNELGEYDLLEQLMDKLHHDNPLAKKVSNAYLHLPSVIRVISWLKQAGLSADDLRAETIKNQAFFKSVNKFLSTAFQSPTSPKQLTAYNSLLSSLRALISESPSQVGSRSAEELAEAIDQIDPSSRFAQPMTIWRNKWLSQIKKGQWRFADQQKNVFLLQLADLYDSYQTKLIQNGLYTFDDMILRTTRAIEANEELKLNLQEKYQYILVDEYQDTNGAQDKILIQLSDNPVNEGRPNLMVVGDDDQAIYRFQGANSSVMQDFINRWQPERVVLVDSYRSGQDLLDLARGVIINANDRIENSDPKIAKNLIARGKVKSTKISELFSSTEVENYINAADAIKQLIDNDQKPSSIAVLAPKHRYLEALVPYLLNLGLPINYERRDQILLQPRIVDILNLISLISAASKFKPGQIEALLPQVLSAEYWQLDAGTLWDIAITAQKDHRGWLSVLENHENKTLKKFAEAIKVLAKDAKNQPFDLLLAYLTGSKSIRLSDGSPWDLPWRNYYYSESQLAGDPSGYISFMSQFEALKRSFRDWQPDGVQLKTVIDFEEFINLYRKTKFKLSDNNAYSSSPEAVSLMTVYRAKGLEWDSVFVLNAEEDVWGAKARSQNQTFTLPSSLRWIEPAMDSSNDLIRLFYVGLTRARRQLFLTSYSLKDSGQPAERLNWLEPLLPTPTLLPHVPASVVVSSYQYSWQDIYRAPTKELSTLLKPVLDTYKLSSTHLIDFLGVNRGGPKNFLFKHILKVPEELNPNALYGDSIHKTLEYIHKQVKLEKKLPDNQAIKTFFTDRLKELPLTKDEFKFFKKRGEDNLAGWLDQNHSKFQATDISEHDFSRDQIVVGKAKLTGKIDVIRPGAQDLVVIDYKTATPIASWSGLSPASAIKANNYQKQLLFYKLLVDNSSSLRPKTTAKQGIIEFITPDQENNFTSLVYDYSAAELARLERLISVVWNKIIGLDLPDTQNYPATIKGIKAFEDDLIDGKI